MSFTKEVKKELTSIPVNRKEMFVEFATYLNFNADYHIMDKVPMIDFYANSPAIAQRIVRLIKTLYDAETEILVKKDLNFKNRQTIIIRMLTNVNNAVLENDLLGTPLETFELILAEENLKKAMLRTSFIICGSVNDPITAQYHLEMSLHNKRAIIYIQRMMNYFDLNAKIIKRRNKLVVYLKEAERIRDFLLIMGAQNSVFKFEDLRIKRDLSNSINRLMNIELANENKTVLAAHRQVENIEFVREHELIDEIKNDRLKKVMDLRLDYPYATLIELTELYEETYNQKISKSGLNHRFKKIDEIVEQYKEGMISND